MGGAVRVSEAGTAASTTPVVVVAAHDAPLLHSAVAVARSLGARGAPVHLVHPRGRTAASWSRYVRSTQALHLDPAQPTRYVEQLCSLARTIGGAPVLVALDDVAALLIADHAERLGSDLRLNVPAARVARALSDKRQLHDLCLAHGIATPPRAVARSAADAAAFVEAVGLPVVVKATTADDPLAAGAGQSRSVRITHDLDEVLAILDSPGGPREVLLQAYLPGGPESIWMFNGYFDADSVCRLAFTGTKVRQYLPDVGYTSLGECRDNPEVERLAIRFLEQVGYRGIVDLGFRRDARDGRYYLLDVNPRLGATFRLFVGSDGTDVARALYLDLTGGHVPSTRAPAGRRWVTEPQDLAAALIYHRDGRLPLRSWAGSYRGVRETAWFSLRDPAPFVAMLAGTAALALGRRASSRAAGSAVRRTQETRQLFDARAGYWRDVYAGGDVEAAIYSRRQERALQWVEQCGAGTASDVLEVGAGAGLATMALAPRVGTLTALDFSSAMVEQLRAAVTVAGLRDRVRVARADAEALPLASGCQDLVLALGVLPWLGKPERALAEMRRVLRPGGHLVVSADNLQRLHWRLDPMLSPALQRPRRALRLALASRGAVRHRTSETDPTLHDLACLRALVDQAGFTVVSSYSLGFGPFSLLGRTILPARTGRAVDAWLQRRTENGSRRLSGLAAQHLLLCRVADAPGTTGQLRDIA
ncbi:MAG: hypothetical protein NVS3B26_28850 [Mycobacteriales bacterium]